MKLDKLKQSPIYNRDSISFHPLFLISSYINISFLIIFLLLLLRKKHFSSALLLVFPCGLAGKESACNAGDLGSIPRLRRSPAEGKDYPLQYSGLENSMGCIVHGIANCWTRLSDFHFHFSRFFGLSNNQIDIRQINKRRIHLITYLPGPHKDNETQEQVRQLRL